MPNFRNQSDYERKIHSKGIYGYSQWVGGRAVRDDLPESYSYTEETYGEYNRRRAGLLQRDMTEFARRMASNTKKYDGFDDFIKSAQEQSSRLDNLLKIDLYKNISEKEKQTMNKLIDGMICGLLATMDSVALYDDHLKAGAMEAVQSVEKMLDCVEAMASKNNEAAEKARKEAAKFSQDALTAHKNAVNSEKEPSSKELKSAANKMYATTAALALITLGIIVVIILSVITFGVADVGFLGLAGIIFGGATAAAGGFYFSGRAYAEAEDDSFNAEVTKSMESAFANDESEKPENSANHMNQLHKGSNSENTTQHVDGIQSTFEDNESEEGSFLNDGSKHSVSNQALPVVANNEDQSKASEINDQPYVNNTIQVDEVEEHNTTQHNTTQQSHMIPRR